jgi:sortase A
MDAMGARRSTGSRGSVLALAFAESQGAAPGTELRLPAHATACGGRGRRALVALAVLCAILAAWQGGQAAYLHAKAALGQWLLSRAWDEARSHGVAAKPWPWADTRPVARLTSPAHGVDLLVLDGANGRTLAWGPAHVAGTTVPGSPGNAIVTGHRDTHFAFLRDLRNGDALVVEAADGSTLRYRVERAFVADRSQLKLPADGRSTTLALVTCYPFDAVDPGTPLRYAVVARAEAP